MWILYGLSNHRQREPDQSALVQWQRRGQSMGRARTGGAMAISTGRVSGGWERVRTAPFSRLVRRQPDSLTHVHGGYRRRFPASRAGAGQTAVSTAPPSSADKRCCTVFKLTFPLTLRPIRFPPSSFFTVFNTTNIAVLIPSVAGETYQLQYTASMSPTNWINTGEPALSIGGPLYPQPDIMETQPSPALLSGA